MKALAMSAALAMAVSACVFAASKSPTDPEGEELVHLNAFRNRLAPFFVHHPRLRKAWPWLHYAMEPGVREGRDGVIRVTGLYFQSPSPGVSPGDERARRDAERRGRVPETRYGLSLPPLAHGDVFPVPNGMLFRVASADLPGRTAHVRRHPPERVLDAPRVGDRCRIVAFHPASSDWGADYAPFGAELLPGKTEGAAGPDAGGETVRIRLFRIPGGGGVLAKPQSEMEVVQDLAAGSTFRFAGARHTVRRIVPPNPAGRIVGWVELEAEPFDEAREAAAWEAERADWVERWGGDAPDPRPR